MSCSIPSVPSSEVGEEILPPMHRTLEGFFITANEGTIDICFAVVKISEVSPHCERIPGPRPALVLASVVEPISASEVTMSQWRGGNLIFPSLQRTLQRNPLVNERVGIASRKTSVYTANAFC